MNEELLQAIVGAPAGRTVVGRFAPSPTGRMHLGNVYAALMSYLSARSRGGRWIVRMEDIDTQRSRREYAEQLLDDLHWLGLQPDGAVEYQSDRYHIYNEYLQRLAAAGLVYPCRCTRAEIMASAPHQSDGHVVYSGRCRPAQPRYDAATLRETLRLRVNADAVEEFADDLCGPQRVAVAAEFGDFALRRRDGMWAYQFAVAIDDALMGVTEVVRGDDLLLSTAPQRYIQRLLGLPQPERYVHLPLLRNASGQRLSKRDGSLSLAALRPTHSPEAVLAQVLAAANLHASLLQAL
ncbi:MAG: tRNA glutamyl-Q(34) synthetase GluQRS [Muribaculaceae bacterium]